MVNCDRITEIDLAQIARTKYESEALDRHRAVWLAVWSSVAPDPALSMLETCAQAITDAEVAQQFVMHFAVTLLAERRRHGLVNGRDAYCTPQHLLRLHTILHLFIQRADDLQRAGRGVYSPTLRDQAQEARNRVFELLKDIPGKEAYLALLAIAAATPDAHDRCWIEYHADGYLSGS